MESASAEQAVQVWPMDAMDVALGRVFVERTFPYALFSVEEKSLP